MSLLKYSNGWGHLIMSVVTTVAGVCLMLFSVNPTYQGLGVTLVLGVNGTWYISGSVKQVASEVATQVAQQTGGTNGADQQKNI